VLVEAVKADLKPRDIVTKKSIENAVAVIMATGGSTNAVLHFLAIAHAAEVDWTIDDFERVRRKVPVLCDLKPSGKYLAIDLHRAGGIPQVMKDAAERRPAARRLHDHHRQDGGREPGRPARRRAPTRT
jgi:dihydroxy-acid dehydratase